MPSNPSLNSESPSDANHHSSLIVDVQSNNEHSPLVANDAQREHQQTMPSHQNYNTLSRHDESNFNQVKSQPFSKRPMLSFLFLLVTLSLTLLTCLLYYYNVFASWGLLLTCSGFLAIIFTIGFGTSVICLMSWNALFLSQLAKARQKASSLKGDGTPLLSSKENTHLYTNNTDDKTATKRVIFKVSKIAFFILVTLIGGIGLIGLVSSSLAWWIVRDATMTNRLTPLQYSQLHADVRVERETQSQLIHIFAEKDEDLFFAQGVVAAQERLWQLEFNRRLAQGRLSEIIGDIDQVKDIDKLMRTVQFYAASQKDWKVIQKKDQTTATSLQRFTDGINAYTASSEVQRPIEFSIFGVKTEKWTPADAIAWIKIMSWDLSGNVKDEAKRYQLMLKGISYDRIREMFPFYKITDDIPTITSRKDLGIDDLTPEQIQEIEDRLHDETGSHVPEPATEEAIQNAVKSIVHSVNLFTLGPDAQNDAFSTARASNNWVVGGDMTRSGHPLLANDPHLELNTPSIWYLVHLHSENIDSVGSALPSVPGVIIGRNSHISWGVTNAFTDVQDLFVLDEVDDKHYKHPSCDGGVCEYNFIEETIKVKGGSDIKLSIKESVYGTVVNDVLGLSHAKNPLALWWSSTRLPDTTAICLGGLMKAKNWNQFKKALSHYVAPAQNFIFADKNNIGYYVPGTVPNRKRGHSGRFPVPGNGKWDYMSFDKGGKGDFIPFEKMPHVYNPEKGYVVSANNRSPPLGYNYTFGLDHAPHYRAARIIEMVEEYANNHTVETFKTMQMDTFSLLYQDMEFLWNETEILDLLPERYHSEWDKLSQWDGNAIWGSQPATLFEGLFQKMRDLTKIKYDTHSYYLNYQWLLSIFKSHKVDEVCINADDGYKTCRQYVVKAFKDLVDALESHDHGNIPMWAVDCHSTLFAHAVLDASPLKCLASRSIRNIGGTMTVNVNGNNGYPNYLTTMGVSYRQIVDWSNVDENSVFIAAPGQSGNMLEASYDNWLDMWRYGEYIHMRQNTSHVSTDTQRLVKHN